MSFKINTNISAMNANIHSNMTNKGVDKSLSSLASGSRLNNAANDVAGLGIADGMSARVAGLGQAVMNANESIGLLQVADGALQNYNDNLERIKTLTLQASNGTLNDSDRANIQKEIDTLLQSSDDIAKSTSFNGIKLLDGTGGSSGNGTFVTQSGANQGETQGVSIGDASVASVVGAIDVTTQAGALSAINTVDGAMSVISDIRSDIGAGQNQLEATIRNTSVTQINTASAESQIRDIDFAAESANFSKQNIMSQIGSFAQAQSNAVASNVLGYLR